MIDPHSVNLEMFPNLQHGEMTSGHLIIEAQSVEHEATSYWTPPQTQSKPETSPQANMAMSRADTLVGRSKLLHRYLNLLSTENKHQDQRHVQPNKPSSLQHKDAKRHAPMSARKRTQPTCCPGSTNNRGVHHRNCVLHHHPNADHRQMPFSEPIQKTDRQPYELFFKPNTGDTSLKTHQTPVRNQNEEPNKCPRNL